MTDPFNASPLLDTARDPPDAPFAPQISPQAAYKYHILHSYASLF